MLRRLVILSLLATTLLFALPRSARATLEEKKVLDGINDTVAVLRFLNQQAAELQENLALVHAARDATQKQLTSVKQLYDNEVAAGNKERAAIIKGDLDRLERQMARLNEFDFEKIYGEGIKGYNDQIKIYTVQLDARMTEYAALYGKKPVIDLNFKKEIEQARGHRVNAANFLDLD